MLDHCFIWIPFPPIIILMIIMRMVMMGGRMKRRRPSKQRNYCRRRNVWICILARKVLELVTTPLWRMKMRKMRVKVVTWRRNAIVKKKLLKLSVVTTMTILWIIIKIWTMTMPLMMITTTTTMTLVKLLTRCFSLFHRVTTMAMTMCQHLPPACQRRQHQRMMPPSQVVVVPSVGIKIQMLYPKLQTIMTMMDYFLKLPKILASPLPLHHQQ
mmetsp:Transcript_12875/g.27943  ORF Transcript_12875/g.27943 Transcript_12875/m.27943 type:complete len:213 (-) Transcript_12875:4101-4739(-)